MRAFASIMDLLHILLSLDCFFQAVLTRCSKFLLFKLHILLLLSLALEPNAGLRLHNGPPPHPSIPWLLLPGCFNKMLKTLAFHTTYSSSSSSLALEPNAGLRLHNGAPPYPSIPWLLLPGYFNKTLKTLAFHTTYSSSFIGTTAQWGP